MAYGFVAPNDSPRGVWLVQRDILCKHCPQVQGYSMNSGKIIFLNGTSSAGKTTLARALQEQLAEPYLHVALDQFRDGLPDKFRGLNSAPGEPGHRGLNVVPVVDQEKPFTSIEFGDVGTQMLRGMRRAMAAMVAEGNNIIIDDIVLNDEFLKDYLEVFAPFAVTFVGVRCPINVINARERSRPGRFPGTAYGHYVACHAHGDYDVEVDTAELSPGQCAAKVAEHVNHTTSGAFRRLADR